jgi:hypothetical protein
MIFWVPKLHSPLLLPLLKSKPTRHNMLSTGLDMWASIIYSNQSGLVITLSFMSWMLQVFVFALHDLSYLFLPTESHTMENCA